MLVLHFAPHGIAKSIIGVSTLIQGVNILGYDNIVEQR
jgi:hypothetical protein